MFLLHVDCASLSSNLMLFLMISLLSQLDMISFMDTRSRLQFSMMILRSYLFGCYNEFDSLRITRFLRSKMKSTRLLKSSGDFSISLPTQKSFMSKNLLTAHCIAILVSSIKFDMRQRNICYFELCSKSL